MIKHKKLWFAWNNSTKGLHCSTFIMPRCTVHRRHTVVRSCVGFSVSRFLGFSVCQILHIFVSDEFQVLKVGQYAKNDILVR